MDLVADFADRFGAPRADTSWHELVSLAKRSGRLQLRDRLVLADGQELGRKMASENDAVQGMMRAKLDRIAWPGGQ